MKLYRDAICRLSKGQGCSLISAQVIESDGIVASAKGAPQQVMRQEPWEEQKGHLEVGFQHARDVLRNPRVYYPGQTYASFSPQTEKALNLTEQRALAGNPTQQAANAELMRNINGEYLYGGPGFNAAFEAAKSKILPDIQSRFAMGGRYGSGLAREAEAKALANAFAEQYGAERQNQLRAMMFAPEMAAQDYKDLQALAGVGQTREANEQARINDAIARHDFSQLEPEQRIAAFLGLIGGNYGGTQTITGFKGNPAQGILGGALGGAAAGAPFGPWGAGIGAAAGGLLGGVM